MKKGRIQAAKLEIKHGHPREPYFDLGASLTVSLENRRLATVSAAIEGATSPLIENRFEARKMIGRLRRFFRPNTAIKNHWI